MRYDYGNFTVAESQGRNFADLDGVLTLWLARAQRPVSRFAPSNLAPVPRNFRFSIHLGPSPRRAPSNDLPNHWISPQPLLGHSASAPGNGSSCHNSAIATELQSGGFQSRTAKPKLDEVFGEATPLVVARQSRSLYVSPGVFVGQNAVDELRRRPARDSPSFRVHASRRTTGATQSWPSGVGSVRVERTLITTGLNVIIVRGDKIAALYVFLASMPS